MRNDQHGRLERRRFDARSENQAQRLAESCAALAGRAGFDATTRWTRDTTEIAQAIADVADELDARLIVTRTRGLHGFRSHLVGSVAGALLHVAHRPVLVVPSRHTPETPHTAPDGGGRVIQGV